MNVNDLPSSYAEADEFLGRKEERACGYATRIERTHEGIAVRHHYTRIAIFHPDGTATFNTGGYHTVSTKRRLNLMLRDSPWRIWSEKGQLSWHYHHAASYRYNEAVEFEDGDRVFLGRGRGCGILQSYFK